MASIYDFTVTRGSEFEVRLALKDENGDTINLSGFNARSSVKHRYSDTEQLAGLSSIIDTTIPGDADGGDAPANQYYASGWLDLKILASTTKTLPVMQAVYDVEIYGNGNNPDVLTTYVKKPVKGYLNIEPEVST